MKLKDMSLEERREYNRNKQKEWYHKNKEKKLLATRLWAKENREHLNAYRRKLNKLKKYINYRKEYYLHKKLILAKKD